MAPMTAHTRTPHSKALSSHQWAELTTRDFAALDPACTVAVLPLGATEQHGPHLPLSVDSVLVDGVVNAALAHLSLLDPVLVLPTQTLGLSTEHTAFAGTLHLSPQTLIQMWCDIGASVARAGVKKLLMFNAHGGNVGLMDVVGREIRKETGLQVFHSNWYDLADATFMEGLFGREELRFGIHAGDTETSLMLAIRPELVLTDQLIHHPSTSEHKAKHFPILGNGRSVKQSWMTTDYSSTGAMGNASLATVEKGRLVLDHVGHRLMDLVREISRF